MFTLVVLSLLSILGEFAGSIFGGLMPKRRSVVPSSAPADLQMGGRQPQNGNYCTQYAVSLTGLYFTRHGRLVLTTHSRPMFTKEVASR